MNYPLLSAYIEAIKAAEENFEQLKHLRPVLDEDGEPVMTSGNFAVVFKMKDEQTGKLHAVKCFLKEQEGRAEAYRQIAEELEYVSSTFLTPIKYLDKELFVDSSNSEETEFPVLLMDWIEGQTLDKYIREHITDEYKLSLLAYQFSRLAMWLMPQPFAHGDLKPDNILVKDDGTLVLVDYDGMYVPAMKGQKARELGSPDFRYPSRTENDFDEHIDDFSLASILLSLKAIAFQSELLEEYGASDRLLLSEKDYLDIGKCELLRNIFPSVDPELNILQSLFILALEKTNLTDVSFRLFNLIRPKELDAISYEPCATDSEFLNAYTDEFGVIYSVDWRKLLQAPPHLCNYSIKRGTKVICSYAFGGCNKLISLNIPNSVVVIGTSAFEDCKSLTEISLPSINWIPSGLFSNCVSLKSMVIPDSVTSIGIGAFYGCSNLKQISIPSSVSEINQAAFEGCCDLTSVSIPEGIELIDELVFSGCTALESISLPQSLVSIGNEAFYKCKKLTSITIPMNLEILSDNCFAGCENLCSISFPNTLAFIGENVFYGCSKLKEIVIPNRVKEIKDSTFQECKKLNSFVCGNSVVKIGKHAFEGCCNLTSVTLPDSVKEIDDYAFCRCCISSVVMPEMLEKIGNHAFEMGINVGTIYLPPNLKTIGDYSFAWCEKLITINIPKSVMTIGECAFLAFSSLKIIYINNTFITISQNAFENFEHTLDICYIGIPLGSYYLFKRKLPSYATKFVEIDENGHSLATEEEIANAWTDDYGVKYSADRKKLLKAPKDIIDYSVLEGTLIICDSAFSWNEHLKKVSIPNTVTTIGDNSFAMCRNLSTINFPNSIIFIGKQAFWWTHLRQVTIPNSVVEIGDEAFSYCLSLTQIKIPSSVMNIGRNTFYESTNLGEIIVPLGLRDKFASMLPNNKYQLEEQK